MNNQIILKEGFFYILVALLFASFSVIFICDTLGYIGFAVTAILLYIYRDPQTTTHNFEQGVIVAPIDGKVTAIDFSKNKYKIYIDVNLCDKHILKAPIKGKFKLKSFFHGVNLSSTSYKAKLLNTQATLKFVSDESSVKIKLISGFFNPEIVVYEDDKKVKIGENIGVFVNGLVLVEFDRAYTLDVVLNQKIVSGETVIGKSIAK